MPMTAAILHEPADVYHAKAAEYLTSHQLADFRKCPLLYWKKKQGLVPDEDRPAYLVGRALHTLVLEGQDPFDREYAVGGPINPKTGQPYGPNTKAFADWAATCGKQVLTESQAELVHHMAQGICDHQIASDLLASGVPEGVVRADYCGMPCRAVGVMTRRDSAELHNIPLVISVRSKKRPDTDEIVNEIRGYAKRETVAAPQATTDTPPWRRS